MFLAVKGENRLSDRFEQEHADQIAGNGAEDRCQCADKGDSQPFQWLGDDHRNQQHIRRYGEKRAFGKGNAKQGLFGMLGGG